MRRKGSCVTLAVLLSLSASLFFLGDNESMCSKKLTFLASPIPTQGDRNIFFVETSCAVKRKSFSNYSYSSGLVLGPRAACAVESAARAHPQRPVFLVHSCPVDEEDPLRGAPPFARALMVLPNVFLWHAPFDHLFKDSPFQGLIASGVLRQSNWPEPHGSDILRYFLLWKYGGTYLDTDILVLRPLDGLHDFSCAESYGSVSAGAMDFSWEAPGRLLANKCLEEILHFSPKVWGANGPGVIMRSMQAVCGVRKVKEMTREKCHGFQLLPTPAIYPVFYTGWPTIFKAHLAEKAMKAINGSYAIHMWNMRTKTERVNTSSNEAYAQIARRVCPSVISNVGEFM